jgi:hypothetical protein
MTMSVAETRSGGTSLSDVQKIVLTWTSAADGTASYTTSLISGTLYRVVFNPGSAAPTDNYDVTLTDTDGIDVLSNQGQNRDTANTEQICPGIAIYDGVTTSTVPICLSSTLVLAITNAGDTKNGTITLYLR